MALAPLTDRCFTPLWLSYSLAITYSQTGLWGVLRSLTPGLTSLRDNMWAWRHLAPSEGVRVRLSPTLWGP